MATTYPDHDRAKAAVKAAGALTDKRMDRVVDKNRRLPECERPERYFTPDQFTDVRVMVDLDIDRLRGEDLYHSYYGLVAS